jgi:hypothetical protein
MAISFFAAGSALAGTVTTLSLVAPALATDDIIIAQISTNDNDVVTAATGFTSILLTDGTTTALRSNTYYKRAVAADSGATFEFTGLAGTVYNFGILTVYRGCVRVGSPIGNTSTSANASSTLVTYATLTPTANTSFIVACGSYLLDLSAAGAMSGTAPTFVNVVDVETTTGVNGSMFQYSGGIGVGGATGSLTHGTGASAAISIGDMFELLSEHGARTGLGEAAATYPRRSR